MIDWTKAEDLRSEIGNEDFVEIVGVFLEEVDEALAALPDCPQEQLPAALHFIKGSALNLGFVRLADLCAEGERVAKDGQGGQVNRSVILEAYAASKTEFSRRYSA